MTSAPRLRVLIVLPAFKGSLAARAVSEVNAAGGEGYTFFSVRSTREHAWVKAPAKQSFKESIEAQ